MRAGRAIAASLAVMLAAAAAETALADVRFRATAEPQAIAFPSTRDLAYRLEMTTEARPEEIGIRLGTPQWGQVGDQRPGGSPIALDSSPSMEGPGRILSLGFAAPAIAQGACIRGAFGGLSSVRVALPPDSTSTLLIRARQGRFPPWTDTDYRLRFTAVAAATNSLGTDRTVATPQPALGPRFGVRVPFHTHPATAPAPPGNVEIRRGEPITIHGRTDPSVPGQKLVLRYLDPRGATRTIARVTVRPNGGFGHRGWRPSESGRHELFVVYRSQRADLARDRSCQRLFDVV